MSLGLLGKKLGMTHIYDKNGRAVPVTAVDISDNEVTQVKTADTDGYSAVQVGFDNKSEKRVNKPDSGHFKKAGVSPKYHLREFRMEGAQAPAAGSKLSGDLFQENQWVDVIGVTKGRGFQGVVKRYRFGGLRMTHGSMMHRRTGAIGCRLTPGRVWKNQKMPGHMGVDRRTVQNLQIVSIRKEDQVLLISGSIPGPKGGLIIVRPAKKRPAPAAQ